jgi:uncharacterized protein with FMN-binding domain
MTSQPAVSSTRVGLALASLVLAVLLLIGFKGPDGTLALGASDGGSGTGGASGTSGGSTPGAATSPPSTSGGSTGSGSGGALKKGGTFDGTPIDVGYGVVQVEVTVAGGKVTNVTELSLPSGGRSGRISSYAAPVLEQETLSAQTARIDLVSGATYTSEGFRESLQSALNQAGL